MTQRDDRHAALATVLAKAFRDGDIQASDALGPIKHVLRKRHTNKALRVPFRSEAAQASIDEHEASGHAVPKNGSKVALHSDHVYPLRREQLETLITRAEWLAALPQLDLVVCVTATENYDLQKMDVLGVSGPEKYARAGIAWASGEGLRPLTQDAIDELLTVSHQRPALIQS